jgi:tRNA-dihydrouridine synthase 1
MIHCKCFQEKEVYRTKFFDLVKGTPPQDRPLIAQLCGSDLQLVLKTAKQLEPFVDGIDLNCGCPQSIAKRGNYGAFLLEQPHVLLPLVQSLVTAVHLPISVKVRILPTGIHDSLQLYQQLVHAGISLLSIHGRNRWQKGPLTGQADWSIIQKAVKAFPTIPILANGSMSNLQEIRACLEYTKCDGVMCSEALLEYPPIYLESISSFSSSLQERIGPGRLQICQEYLQLAQQYPPNVGGQGSGIKCLKAHVHRFLHKDLQIYTEIRNGVCASTTLEDLMRVVQELEILHRRDNHQVKDERLSWYVRHGVKEEMERKKLKAYELELRKKQERAPSLVECDDDEGAELGCAMFEEQDDDGDY